jgi:hypothetical protein
MKVMGLYGAIIPHLLAHVEHVWDIVGYMGTVVMQHGGVPSGREDYFSWWWYKRC